MFDYEIFFQFGLIFWLLVAALIFVFLNMILDKKSQLHPLRGMIMNTLVFSASVYAMWQIYHSESTSYLLVFNSVLFIPGFSGFIAIAMKYKHTHAILMLLTALGILTSLVWRLFFV